MIPTWLVALLLLRWSDSAAAGQFFRVSVQSLVPVQIGQSATLPCWLHPPQSAETLVVQWYHDGEDSYIILHKIDRFLYAGQNTTYEGRVSFGTRDAAPGGLTSGDVSLRLVNVTLQDAAEYRCSVSSHQHWDSALVRLAVFKTGSPVRLSVVRRDNHTVNVSCESVGWYPEPGLHWRDSAGALTPRSLKINRDSSGLVSVHSWILVSSSSKISCSVGLNGAEAKEASVYLDHPSRPGDPDSGHNVPGAGWVAFTLLLALFLVLAVLAGLWIRKRGMFCWRRAAEEKRRNGGNIELLLRGGPSAVDDSEVSGSKHKDETKVEQFEGKTTEVVAVEEEVKQRFDKKKMEATDLSKAREVFVDLRFSVTMNPNLTLLEGSCKVMGSEQSRSLRDVTTLTAVTGSTGFSSGRHYWEVSLRDAESEVKTSWWLGVTRLTVVPNHFDIAPIVSEGFWFLSSSSNGLWCNTEPGEPLPVPSRPETVGVYLDCDTGELSFYDVGGERLIGSLTVDGGRKLHPLFNTGLGDRSSMTLIHKDGSRARPLGGDGGRCQSMVRFDHEITEMTPELGL